MKLWFKRTLPTLSLAAAALATANLVSVPTATAANNPSTWMAKSGLPSAAAHVLQAEIDHQIAHYGGTQVSPYEVSYNNGNPIMVFANPMTGEFPTSPADRVEAAAAPTASGSVTPNAVYYRYGCPYGNISAWFCFYQNINFNHYSCSGGATPPCTDNGRLLQFQDCGTQSLQTYGFQDETSSWVNNTSSHVRVYDLYNTELWDESPGSASAYVGDANNDLAWSFDNIC